MNLEIINPYEEMKKQKRSIFTEFPEGEVIKDGLYNPYLAVYNEKSFALFDRETPLLRIPIFDFMRSFLELSLDYRLYTYAYLFANALKIMDLFFGKNKFGCLESNRSETQQINFNIDAAYVYLNLPEYKYRNAIDYFLVNGLIFHKKFLVPDEVKKIDTNSRVPTKIESYFPCLIPASPRNVLYQLPKYKFQGTNQYREDMPSMFALMQKIGQNL